MRLANRYAGRGEPLEDLVQVGSLGLIKAVDRFDVDRSVEVLELCRPDHRQGDPAALRDKAWAMRPRRLRGAERQALACARRPHNRLGRSPTIAELAEVAGADEEEVIDALDSANAYSTRSLHAPYEEGETTRSRRSSSRGHRLRSRADHSSAGLDALDEQEDASSSCRRRGDDPVADRRRGRDLADARVETSATRARDHAWEDRGDGTEQ